MGLKSAKIRALFRAKKLGKKTLKKAITGKLRYTAGSASGQQDA
jgi:hypothetical protein